MQIYWSLKSIPELSVLPRAERGRRWRAVSWKTFRHWQTWASLAGLALCSGLGVYLGALIDPSTTSMIIGGVIAGVPAGFVYGQVVTVMARPYLHTFLAR
ncbi:MAG: hypothetical protein AAB403_07980 [Planctomycetota bacterium]